MDSLENKGKSDHSQSLEAYKPPQGHAKPSPWAIGLIFVLLIIFLFLIFALVLAIGFLYLGNGDAATYVPPPAGCGDGTLSGECSENQPYYCSNGELEKKATLCGCPKNLGAKGDGCSPKCKDGTVEDDCSYGKPLYCLNGSLIPKASLCGCTKNYVLRGDTCTENLTCLDGTLYGECAPEAPLYCQKGTLINKSSVCNCSDGQVPLGEECISEYQLGPDQRLLKYTLRARTAGIVMTVYKGLNDRLALLPRTYTCRPACPSEQELEMRFLDNEKQAVELEKLVKEIRAITLDRDDQARIAVSLVQSIPYDYESFEARNLTNRYPYQVLYEDKGVCGEKSHLLAFILRELGYGVVLLNYKQENHMAVGIKCPEEYSQYIYNKTSYCFIESTAAIIITNNKEEYVSTGKLKTNPIVYTVSDGSRFEGAYEEYNDSQELKYLTDLSNASNGKLSWEDYNIWQAIIKKYNIPTGNQTKN